MTGGFTLRIGKRVVASSALCALDRPAELDT
jgi:hypothetical protein